jgi:phage/plasmid primase-like uncharacterized protein
MTLADQIALRAPARRKLPNGSWAIPTPGHSIRDRGTVIHPRADGGVTVYSFNNDPRDTRLALGVDEDRLKPLSSVQKRKLAEAERVRIAAQIRRAADLWSLGDLVALDSPVRRSLRRRHISSATVALVTRAGGAIREHRDDLGRFSRLALARDLQGRGRAVQLTKLMADGGKRGDPARLTFGRLKGAYVQLLSPTGGELAICEGVEDALAFYDLHRIPAWASLGTANLSGFAPPAGVKRLYIAADNDAAGRAAAGELFERLSKRVRCTMALPPEGQDWADVLAAKHEGAP